MSAAGPQTLHAPLKPITHLPSDPPGKLSFSLDTKLQVASSERARPFFSQQSPILFPPLARHLLQAPSRPVFSQQTASHWANQLPFNPAPGGIRSGWTQENVRSLLTVTTRFLGEVILFGSQFPHQKTFGRAYLPTIPFTPSAVTEHFPPQPKLGLGQKNVRSSKTAALDLEQSLIPFRITRPSRSRLTYKPQVKNVPGNELSAIHAMVCFSDPQTFSERGQSKFLQLHKPQGLCGHDSTLLL